MSVIVPVIIYMLISFLFFKWLLYSNATKEMVLRVLNKHKFDYSTEEIVISLISSFLIFHTIVSAIAMLITFLAK